MLAEVTFADVIRQDHDYVVLLLEKETHRVVGIRTDFHEATTIGWIAQGCPDLWNGRGQPGIHKFLKKVLAAAGASITGAAVRTTGGGEFIARLGLALGETTENLPARPSDAVIMALLARTPIRVDRKTLRDAGRDLESVYTRATLGKPTRVLIETLRELWAAQDARVYANAAVVQANGHGEPEGEPVSQEIRLVDVLGDDPVVKTVVFWSKAGRRMLPVRVPAWDAEALARLSAGGPSRENPERSPETCRLAADVLAAAGVAVRRLEITGIRDGILRAVAGTEIAGVPRDFDLRPVDAAGLAVALGLPLCAAGHVVETAGIPAGGLYRSRSEVGAGLSDLARKVQRSSVPRSAWTRIGSILRGS